MTNKILGFAAASLSAVALGLSFTAPASAAVTFADPLKASCNIYDLASGGCKFTYDSENDVKGFAGLEAIFQKYNAERNPDLVAVDYVGKININNSGVFDTEDFASSYDANANIDLADGG